MKAFIHAFQGKPWNEECEAAYTGFNKLEMETVLFTTNEELDERTPKDIVVGGMLIMSHAFGQLGIELPNYNYPKEIERYTGRNIWTVKIKDLRNEKLPIFVKPIEEKAAKGIVVRSWNDIYEYEKMDPEADVLCSDVVKFVSEWRCFIRYGKVLGIQFYNGDKATVCDFSVVEGAVREFKTQPSAYSLDFGVTDDGRTLLIEMNDGLAIGCYGLPDVQYAKFLYARWAELVNVDDPFDSRKYEDSGITSWGTHYKTYFKDKSGKPCRKEDCFEYHIHEFDENGNFSKETIAHS